MRERRKAEEESQDEGEWEVWKPPPHVFGGLIGSHAPSGPAPVASYRSRKDSGVKPRWTRDDADAAQEEEDE